MIWFLRLFPQYRKLESMVREGGDLSTKLQDQNYALTTQNIKLAEEAQQSRDAQVEALKMLANIRIQVSLGGLPPYPEAYSLPRIEEQQTGPVPTNRIQGRDAVRQGIEDFRTQIFGLEKRS